MAYRICYYRDGRPIGVVPWAASLDEAIKFARAEMAAREADYFYVIDEAGKGDVWREARKPD